MNFATPYRVERIAQWVQVFVAALFKEYPDATLMQAVEYTMHVADRKFWVHTVDDEQYFDWMELIYKIATDVAHSILGGWEPNEES
ncbi:hypothetical protein TA3x_004262 [Tundrisphaera sp. TA3]|uniref:hypothetical protein n=1 Tax=Tundrisphaera sp. TA3 TaxID=3435775 RepID=UPI003EC06529